MDEARGNDGLKYIGAGTAIIGVPARDLSPEEVQEHGRNRLIHSGLYEEFVKVKKVYVPKPVKSAQKGGEEQADKE
jgi:hypothetical protein